MASASLRPSGPEGSSQDECGFDPEWVDLAHANDAPVPAEPPIVESARELYRRRRHRERLFRSGLFSDPVWDILLDLFIAQSESRSICVSSACIGASVPTTTALRHINYMIDAGLLNRIPNPVDSRSRLLELTCEASRLMTEYLSWVVLRDGQGACLRSVPGTGPTVTSVGAAAA